MGALLSDLMYSINVILPILILVLLGILLKRIEIVGESFCASADKVVFKLALPMMLFREVATASIVSSPDASFLLLVFITVTAVFLAASLLTPLFIKDRAKCGAFVQGICRSNFVILSVPLLEGMFGEAGSKMVAVVIPLVIIMFNAYSVVVLSVFAPKEKQLTLLQTLRKILFNVFTNPLIIAVVLGLPFMLFSWEMPLSISKSVAYISNMATPLALLSLGASFSLSSLRCNLRLALTAALTKTLMLPAVMCTIAALLGVRGIPLGITLVLFGSPTAVSSYIMAKNMGSDHDLAGQILLFTTSICVFTIFLGIFILKRLCLI